MRLPRSLRAARLALAGAGLALLASGCSTVKFYRNTETSGTFRSSGLAFTLLSVDIPKTASDIARENVTDTRLPNIEITEVFVFPYLGPADWLLDFISVRYAVVRGTWGFSGEPATGEAAR